MSESKPEMSSDQKLKQSKGRPIPVKIIPREEEPLRVTDKRFWVKEGDKETEDQQPYSFKPSYVEELEKKLSDSQKQIEEILASYREVKQQSTVEVQKARERMQNDFNRRAARTKVDVVGPFIDILENFERALQIAVENHNLDSLLQGLQLIRSQFLASLADHGVTEIDLSGQPFDPEVAEAVGIIEVNSEEQDQTVMEVVSKGYRLADLLIRPAKVKVGRCTMPAKKTQS
jgi:molecular chaperone GrpE